MRVYDTRSYIKLYTRQSGQATRLYDWLANPSPAARRTCTALYLLYVQGSASAPLATTRRHA